MVDSRIDPPGLSELARHFPEAKVELGEIREDTLCNAGSVVVSPGLSLEDAAFTRAADSGVTLTGDIQLFADEASAPIVAITGTNGKSTVTTLVGEMAGAAGLDVGVGGNLGTPALDLLDENRDLYVLELSSFQLELVDNLCASVATVLNLTPDHMDRYGGIAGYHRAKHRIFRGARQVVVNRDEPLSRPLLPPQVHRWSFGLGTPDFRSFGIREEDGERYLAFEWECLMPVRELRIRGRHNLANALAALALGHAIGLPRDPMLRTLRRFPGLAHRCETIADIDGVSWINDSKATNVGATLAAVRGLAEGEDLILLAGGQGKGQDFTPLAEGCEGRVRLAVLFGEDAGLLAARLRGRVQVLYATDLDSAVGAAARAARPGDKVLLSPACASFDMFRNFEDRGEHFATAVRGLA